MNKDYIDDNFKDWWRWRHDDVLSRWMCRCCLMHRRNVINNPHYDDSPEFVKRVERLKRKANKKLNNP